MKIQNKKQEEKKNYDESTIDGVTMRVYESGFASLALDVNGDTLVINGNIRFTKENTPFFAFPSYKGNNGKYYNNVYIVGDDNGNSALNDTIVKLVNTLVESAE